MASYSIDVAWLEEEAQALIHLDGDRPLANACRVAAAALRWYAKTETGGDDHAERQALIAACREATNG